MNDYVVITPVKNEARYLEHTILSIMNQTRLPKRWIIVDDNSTDATVDMVYRYLPKLNYLQLIRRNNPIQARRRGQGVVEAFYSGYEIIQNEHFDYIVKLDGDLKFSNDFFEQLLNRFKSDPELGLASGVSYIEKDGKWVIEPAAKGYTHGETKMYRRECFQDIGGLVPSMGWDGIDHIKAIMNGWKAVGFDDIVFYHLRPQGKGTGLLNAAYEEGICCHFMGYHPLFFILRSFKRMFEKPLMMGGLVMIGGYLVSIFTRKKRIEDLRFISFLRKNQLKRILTFNLKYTG